MIKTVYDNAFFTKIGDSTHRSATHCVPLFLEIVSPESVIDVGCGQGNWLDVFRSMGISDYLGIDGSHVDIQKLKIPPSNFKAFDLSKPLQLNRKYDLAICLEVGEHLPAESAATLVRSLTTLAPAVFFSAAVPGQGGVHHINEQWPSYWRQQFESQGYVCLDIIRKQIWQNPEIEAYYQQNIFLYVDPDRHPELIDRYPEGRNQQLTLVQSYILERLEEKPKSFWQKLQRLFKAQ